MNANKEVQLNFDCFSMRRQTLEALGWIDFFVFEKNPAFWTKTIFKFNELVLDFFFYHC